MALLYLFSRASRVPLHGIVSVLIIFSLLNEGVPSCVEGIDTPLDYVYVFTELSWVTFFFGSDINLRENV